MPGGENIKINYGMDATGEKEKRTSMKNVDGRSTSSHDKKKFRIRAMEKQRGMASGFRKMATAIKTPDRQTDRQIRWVKFMKCTQNFECSLLAFR